MANGLLKKNFVGKKFRRICVTCINHLKKIEGLIDYILLASGGWKWRSEMA